MPKITRAKQFSNVFFRDKKKWKSAASNELLNKHIQFFSLSLSFFLLSLSFFISFLSVYESLFPELLRVTGSEEKKAEQRQSKNIELTNLKWNDSNNYMLFTCIYISYSYQQDAQQIVS